MDQQKLFKVLSSDGKPCHGGSGTWKLPKGNKPGAWMPAIQGALVMCTRGYHLTTEPARWWVDGATLYEAEYDGEVINDGGDKSCGRKARLLREVPWSDGQVFTDGQHQVRQHQVSHGVSRAFGSASVSAFGSASVEAFGSASVRASGSASVRASGSASVRAYDSASVSAFDSAIVRAFGSAIVSSTIYHNPSALVALENMAVHIDRRAGKLVFRHANGTPASLEEV